MEVQAIDGARSPAIPSLCRRRSLFLRAQHQVERQRAPLPDWDDQGSYERSFAALKRSMMQATGVPSVEVQYMLEDESLCGSLLPRVCFCDELASLIENRGLAPPSEESGPATAVEDAQRIKAAAACLHELREEVADEYAMVASMEQTLVVMAAAAEAREALRLTDAEHDFFVAKGADPTRAGELAAHEAAAARDKLGNLLARCSTASAYFSFVAAAEWAADCEEIVGRTSAFRSWMTFCPRAPGYGVLERVRRLNAKYRMFVKPPDVATTMQQYVLRRRKGLLDGYCRLRELEATWEVSDPGGEAQGGAGEAQAMDGALSPATASLLAMLCDLEPHLLAGWLADAHSGPSMLRSLIIETTSAGGSAGVAAAPVVPTTVASPAAAAVAAVPAAVRQPAKASQMQPQRRAWR
eukprot:scaffold11.g4012.t1